jgi:hypothetical protein
VSPPNGFRFETRKNGDVIVFHHGQVACVLRGQRASAFIEELNEINGQEIMARLTGNYKRGNERTAAKHPRNKS